MIIDVPKERQQPLVGATFTPFATKHNGIIKLHMQYQRVVYAGGWISQNGCVNFDEIGRKELTMIRKGLTFSMSNTYGNNIYSSTFDIWINIYMLTPLQNTLLFNFLGHCVTTKILHPLTKKIQALKHNENDEN